MKKIYYQCCFEQTSPLRLSNGEGDRTDNDLLLDRNGNPFIPGSAVAGVLQTMFTEDDSDKKLLFGWYDKTQRKTHESRLQISDALLRLPETGFVHKTVRHGVGLNDQGVAEDKRKYEFEVVETNGTYICVLELTVVDEQEKLSSVLERLMQRLVAEGIAFGARTSRGYGSMRVKVYRKYFDFDAVQSEINNDGKRAVNSGELAVPKVVDEWLDFNPFSFDRFGWSAISGASPNTSAEMSLSVNLEMRGSFAVRVYSADPQKADYMSLKTKEGKPVFPGTGWAGAFRHHMRRLAEEAGLPECTKDKIDMMFGVRPEEEPPVASSIRFSEMNIEGGEEIIVTRVALDRYTMKPRQRALFTSAIWQGGRGTLDIHINKKWDDDLVELFYASLLDMHFGLLTVGGEANVGRGCAKIVGLKLNGEPVDNLLGVSLGIKEG